MRRHLLPLCCAALALALAPRGLAAQEHACRPLTGFGKYIKQTNEDDARRQGTKPDSGHAVAVKCKKPGPRDPRLGRAAGKESSAPRALPADAVSAQITRPRGAAEPARARSTA
jgi:hypothetical protein